MSKVCLKKLQSIMGKIKMIFGKNENYKGNQIGFINFES